MGIDCTLPGVCPCFCTLHTDEISRTDRLVKVDCVRVVDLAIGANKSNNCTIGVVTISERVGRLEPATAVSAETDMENVESSGDYR
jgi:hypothetical protein